MKYFISTLFFLTIFLNVYSQVVPIEIFISLIDQPLSTIDDRLTKDFKAELDQVDESNGVFSWKKGFNGDHSQNNQYIIFKKNDSTYEFWYDFVTDLNYGRDKTYYDY